MKYIFMVIFSCVIFFSMKAQAPRFNCTVSNNSIPIFNRSGCSIAFPDFLNTADLTVQVNFHVTQSYKFSSTTEIITDVKNLLKNMNERYLNLDYYRVNNVLQSAAFVPRAKIKFKLYTESSNTNDSYGGIWLYPNSGPTSADFTDRYNGKVLNIVLWSPTTDCTNFDIESYNRFQGEWNGYRIIVNDFFCKRNDPIAYLSITTDHELAHALGLSHPEYCSNECAGVDINPVNECNSNCPQILNCSVGSDHNNGGQGICDISKPKEVLCNSCDRSNLFTSACFTLAYRRAMTPCQWETVFNGVIAAKPLYALLCYTASIFTLSASPLNDYRASGSITSSSVINGDRMVDYWAPMITLNAGFNVQLGTTFIAGPATFPCCTGAAASPSPSLSPTTSPNNILTTNLLTVIPNPFGDYIQVKYQIDSNNELDKPSLIMTDITGKVVKNIPINAEGKGEYQIEVKTNDLLNGIYFIQYQSNGNTVTQKIVKANQN